MVVGHFSTIFAISESVKISAGLLFSLPTRWFRKEINLALHISLFIETSDEETDSCFFETAAESDSLPIAPFREPPKGRAETSLGDLLTESKNESLTACNCFPFFSDRKGNKIGVSEMRCFCPTYQVVKRKSRKFLERDK